MPGIYFAYTRAHPSWTSCSALSHIRFGYILDMLSLIFSLSISILLLCKLATVDSALMILNCLQTFIAVIRFEMQSNITTICHVIGILSPPSCLNFSKCTMLKDRTGTIFRLKSHIVLAAHHSAPSRSSSSSLK